MVVTDARTASTAPDRETPMTHIVFSGRVSARVTEGPRPAPQQPTTRTARLSRRLRIGEWPAAVLGLLAALGWLYRIGREP
jgi:hypothetical protein